MTDTALPRGNSIIPRHVAIIMDGNGRWAKKRSLPRIMGHRQGAVSVREVVRRSGERGVEALTLFAFGEENWGRPHEEVQGIMSLLDHYILRERKNLLKENVRFSVMGRRTSLAPKTQKLIAETEEMLSGNTGILLNIAISYSGRSEILECFKTLARKVSDGELGWDSLTEESLNGALQTNGLPDPDLLIRTSGELRLSNFMLWQCAYSELYFTDTLWPDFGSVDFDLALESFARRQRRFGLVETSSANKPMDINLC